MRIIGIDPGLQRTGWGVIDARDNRLSFVAEGTVTSDAKQALAQRLMQLHDGLVEVIETWSPEQAAVEETFVNKNPTSTLKLGKRAASRCWCPHVWAWWSVNTPPTW